MQDFSHATPELRLHHGAGALAQLPRELERLGCRRAAVVCGATIAAPGQGLDLVRAALGDACAGAFTGVREHSPVPSVHEAARFLAQTRADAVVALGGGSAIVTARAAAILLAEGRQASELCTRRGADGRMTSPRLAAAKLPQFVVPTTPTTACVKAGSALLDPASGERLALFDPKTRAKALFIDPALVLGAPAGLVRSASLNTLAMAVESLESAQGDPLSDAALMHALRLLAEHLPQLDAAPHDAALRGQLMLAAVLCGQGTDFAGGGLASVLGHAIGPRCGVANGVVNAIVLPHTMRFNAPATRSRAHKVVQALSTAPAFAPSAVAAVEGLLARLAIPRTLRDAGVERGAFDAIVAAALDDWFLQRNPQPVQRADLQRLLDAAW